MLPEVIAALQQPRLFMVITAIPKGQASDGTTADMFEWAQTADQPQPENELPSVEVAGWRFKLKPSWSTQVRCAQCQPLLLSPLPID